MPIETGLIFATACYAVFDTRAGVVRYAAAGHPSPLLISASSNSVEEIVDSSHNDPAIGLIPDAVFRTFERLLAPGDLFVFYTDGVLEAPNVKHEEFGAERLRKTVLGERGEKGEAVANKLVSELNSFMDVVVAPDDICIVTVDILDRR